MDALSTLEASADSLWLRVTAKEMLAFEYLRRNETQDAQTRFIALADMRNTEPVIAKRALLAVVVLRTGAFRNADSAMSAYVFLSQYYPGTRALMYAKVLLRLPLTAEDEDAMRPMMPKAVNEEAPDVYAMPENEGLAHPWPNPFTTRTKLQYKIDVAGMVRLSIYNNAGMEIRRLVSSELAAGEYSVLFERGTLPAGIYSCRLEISGSGKEPSRVYVKGLILIK
jgi:hypothetical protein